MKKGNHGGPNTPPRSASQECTGRTGDLTLAMHLPMHSSGASWSLSGRLGGSLGLLGGSLGSLAMGKNGEIHKKAKGNRKTGQKQWETRWENGRTAGKLIKNNGKKTVGKHDKHGKTVGTQWRSSRKTVKKQRHSSEENGEKKTARTQ